MSLGVDVHQRVVHRRRIRRLAALLAEAAPRSASLLDVGAGDGRLALALQENRPDLSITCLDIAARPAAVMPIQTFNGTHIPLENAAVDYVMFVDVLHHIEDPRPLLHEARRVARHGLLIKDHLQESRLDQIVLSAMDWAGNAGHGVSRTYRYWNRAWWESLAVELGGTWSAWTTRLDLYAFPISLICDRGLHFVGRLDWPKTLPGSSGHP